MTSEQEKNVRYRISMPRFYYRRVKLWAYLEGTDRAGLTTDVTKAAVNENWSTIDERLNQLAEAEGRTREELENQVLGEKD